MDCSLLLSTFARSSDLHQDQEEDDADGAYGSEELQSVQLLFEMLTEIVASSDLVHEHASGADERQEEVLVRDLRVHLLLEHSLESVSNQSLSVSQSLDHLHHGFLFRRSVLLLLFLELELPEVVPEMFIAIGLGSAGQ